MRSVRRSGAVAIVLVAGLLAGCGAQPGVAAVIGDRKIAQSELDLAAEQLSPILNTTEVGTLLGLLVLSSDVREAAAEQGVAVSAEATRDRMDEVAELVEAEPTDWSPLAVEIIQVSLSGEALNQTPAGAQALQAAQAEALAQDVELSPRYGSMDPQTGQILPRELPWIVRTQPAPEVG